MSVFNYNVINNIYLINCLFLEVLPQKLVDGFIGSCPIVKDVPVAEPQLYVDILFTCFVSCVMYMYVLPVYVIQDTVFSYIIQFRKKNVRQLKKI